MNTVGIWYEPKTGEDPTVKEVRLHINFWKLKDKSNDNNNNFVFILDIGLMIPKISEISNIKIYLPFAVNNEHIQDIGRLIAEEPELANAVFNEYFEVSRAPTNKVAKAKSIRGGGGGDEFQIYMFDPAADLTIEEEGNDASVATIKTSEIQTDDNLKTYLRLRISSPSLRVFSQDFKPEDHLLEKVFTSTEIIDFRLNEKRNLNVSILQKMTGGEFTFEKIHFLHLRDASDDFIFAHRPPDAAREIEQNLWASYVGNNFDTKNVLAYHWKEKDGGPFESYNALVKVKYRHYNWTKIISYTIAAVALAISVSVAGNFITDLVGIGKPPAVEQSKGNGTGAVGSAQAGVVKKRGGE